MDYETDTLTNANRNRQASKKIFDQWTNQNSNQQRGGCYKGEALLAKIKENNASFCNTQSYENTENNLENQQLSSSLMNLIATLCQNNNSSSSTITDNLNNYQQEQQFVASLTNAQQPPTMMLHRTASGAQKKIKQKREEKIQSRLPSHSFNIPATSASKSFISQPSTYASNNINASNGQSETPIVYSWNVEDNQYNKTVSASTFNSYDSQSAVDYRSMVDLHGYRSILPDERHNNNGESRNLWSGVNEDSDSERDHEISSTFLRFMEPSDIKFLSSNLNVNRINETHTAPLIRNNKPNRPPRASEITRKSLIASQSPMLQYQHKKSLSSSWDDRNIEIENTQNKNTSFESLENASWNNGCNNNELHQIVGGIAHFGKPTVQVYPMPILNDDGGIDSLSSSTTSISPPETLKKHMPPPVPKKPNQVKSKMIELYSPASVVQTNNAQHQHRNTTVISEKDKNLLFWTSQTVRNGNSDFSVNTAQPAWKTSTAALKFSASKSPPTILSNEVCTIENTGSLPVSSVNNHTSDILFMGINSENNEPILASSFNATTETTPLTLGAIAKLNLVGDSKPTISTLENCTYVSLDKCLQSVPTVNNNPFPRQQLSFQRNLATILTSNLTNSNNNNNTCRDSVKQKLQKFKSLSHSPSLLSLHEGLNQALSNPEQHTLEELHDLEQRRIHSILILTEKAAARKVDLEMIRQDLEKIDESRDAIFQVLLNTDNNSALLSRLQVHIVEGARLSELEAKLSLQLEKLKSSSISGQNDEQFWLGRRQRLMEQLGDVNDIRIVFDERDTELDTEISIVFRSNPNILSEWCYYKTTMFKLNVEKKQIEEKLHNVEKQLYALEAMTLCENNNFKNDFVAP